MTKSPEILGYLFALTSAFLWALVAIFYKNIGRKVSSAGMNIGKSLVATLCLAIVLFIRGFEPIDTKTLFLLIMSGILGISLGDTFFFMALYRLRPSMAVVMTTLIPVLTVLFSVLFLNEHFSIKCWAGITLTIIGIAIVLSKNNPDFLGKKNSLSGIIYGLLTSFCCAASIIFSKCALVSISALEASFIRHIAGLLLLMMWGIASSNLKSWLKPLQTDMSLIGKLFFASFLGTFLGTLFCLLGLKYAPATIATVLNSTSPLFILPLSYIILKERIANNAIIGSMLAVAGVCLVLMESYK
jgi:drug/metabolite transporter (DMT)-like permease